MSRPMESMPDEPAGSGDHDVAKLLEAHLPGLRAFVRLRCGKLVSRRESFSDLVQSVCGELLRERSRFEFRGDDAFRSWLFQAAERKIVDRARYWQADQRDVRREMSQGRVDADQILVGYAEVFTPSRGLAAKEEVDRVERAFDAMPADYREVITASKILGLSHAEIAEQMDRDAGAVRTLLCRALARLSRLLAE